MVVERFELPITFFAKWSYLWELMFDVQKHVFRFKPDTLGWAVDFGLLRVRRLARELRLEKKRWSPPGGVGARSSFDGSAMMGHSWPASVHL